MSQRVLVIGGTRYFGKRLVRRLLDSGAEVTVATRGKTPDSFGGQVDRFLLDRDEPGALGKAVGGRSWDLVFDQICYSPSQAAEACEVFEGRVGRYVHTSTQSIYESASPHHEPDFDPYSYPLKMGPRADFSYGEGKRLAEAAFFQRASFPVVAMRIPIVLGSDDYTGRLQFHLDRVIAGRPIVVANLEAEVCFIHSPEAANFLHWLGGQSCTGALNACSEGRISMRQILEMIEQATGKKAVVLPAGSEADATPFVEQVSRFMDASRAETLGFRFSTLQSWLPALIHSRIG